MQWRKVAMLLNMIFKTTTLSMKQSLKAIDLVFKLTAVANTETRLLPFLVDAFSIVARTPTAGRLCAVALYFSVFTELTAGRSKSSA
jgi:hypothetical protein